MVLVPMINYILVVTVNMVTIVVAIVTVVTIYGYYTIVVAIVTVVTYPAVFLTALEKSPSLRVFTASNSLLFSINILVTSYTDSLVLRFLC